MNVGFERTKMDIEARSKAKKDQMTGKVNKEETVYLPTKLQLSK